MRANELSLVPCHDIRKTNVVESGEEGEEREDDGRDHELPFIESLEERGLLLEDSESAHGLGEQQDKVAIAMGVSSALPSSIVGSSCRRPRSSGQGQVARQRRYVSVKHRRRRRRRRWRIGHC